LENRRRERISEKGIQNPQFLILSSCKFSEVIGGHCEMETPTAFKTVLKQKGYSDNAIKEIWKWYDFSERKGVNF